MTIVLLFQTLYEQEEQKSVIEDLQSQVHSVDLAQEETNKKDTKEPNNSEMKESVEITEETEEAKDTSFLNLDALLQLKEENSDLVGWITIPDTNIDYPVMQSGNQKDYYLTHDFKKESSKYGVPYVDSSCDLVGDCDNIIIYGHHMKDGTMFAPLVNYKQENYYLQHPYIWFCTLTEIKKYEIISVFVEQFDKVDEDSFLYHEFSKAKDRTEYDTYLSKVKELSIYEISATADYGEQLLTLSTCDQTVNEGRFVVVAKEI